ncbi:MAG: hypothetical protein MO846_06665 [Candidatus Devosia symbiotica]|nr:hypothetical protein [Candidatus Devosia symbiotica]
MIATYRLSQQIWPNDHVAAHLEDIVAQYGFRVVDHVIDAEAAAPRICAVFSDPLGSTDLSAYVVVANAPQTSVETETEQICLESVSHSSRYAIKLRAGLS